MFDEVFEMMNNNEIFKKNFNGIYPLVDHNIFKLMFIGISTGLVASFVGGGAEILIDLC